METKKITAAQIFEKKQVLTLEAARALLGKRVAITSPEYQDNTPSVRIFTIKGFESEWDRARNSKCDGYANRQENWKTFMSSKQLDEVKNNLLIITGEGDDMPYATCDLQGSEPFFHGSDADREVYYITLEQ